MVFTSITFLYFFLPFVFVMYRLLPVKARNLFLLIASLFFYFAGNMNMIGLLIGAVIFHWSYGLFLERHRTKGFLFLGTAIDLVVLIYFKYTNFLLDTIGMNGLLPKILLPVGISFFTFQGISYFVDIYRKEAEACHSLVNFGTYLTFFPQLIAGPIVRYETVAKEIENRKENDEDTVKGIYRFVAGLFKKILLADTFAKGAKILMGLTVPSVLSSWMQAIFFTLQLYFDFSGYSDMAIGMGLFFGFHFPENFRYPLTAYSIKDFWRKWHISLSSWFKDYVYIPLGGSRCGVGKQICNLLIVWLLTGIWHGAGWNYILWGLYFAILLMFEKFILKGKEKQNLCHRLVTFLFVVLGFVIFQQEDLQQGFQMYRNMFGLGGLPLWSIETLYYCRSYAILLGIGLFAMTPFPHRVYEQLQERCGKCFQYVQMLAVFIVLVIVTGFLLDEGFHPFLYFRF